MGEDAQGLTIAAIERAYRGGYPRFLRVAVAVLGDLDRARDPVQETFARAIRSRQDFRGGSLDGWLWRTLMNVCLQQKRDVEEPLERLPELGANGQSAEWRIYVLFFLSLESRPIDSSPARRTQPAPESPSRRAIC